MKIGTFGTSSAVRAAIPSILIGLALLNCGCSKTPTRPTGNLITDTSEEIIFSRSRDLSGNIAPVLSEGSGFDGAEVDSPSMAIDKSRAEGDRFMLYYEAQDAGRTNTIGLVTSNEEDLAVLTINRTQVIGLGGSGSGYETGATDPSVIVDKRLAETSRRYKIWFEGRNGSTSKIIYATSTDGLTWTGFTQCTGLTPSFGSVRVADPTVLLDGTTYKMWFEAINTSSGGKDGPGSFGYAESTDGIAWTIKDAAGNSGSNAGAVYTAGVSGQFDGYSVNAPSVVIDTTFREGSIGRYKLWYEASNSAADAENSIGYATSGDGLTWNRATLPVLNPSSDNKVPLPFDSGDLEHPTAYIDYNFAPNIEGHFLLWYTGDGEEGASPNRIGLVKGRTP